MRNHSLCGWICGLHPRLYNRNELKSWIDSLDPDGTIGSKVKLYPRTIFTVDDDGKKTIKNAIIIDGAIEDAKTIMEFLYSIDWDEHYKGANFVPFRTSDTLSKKYQKEAMECHNDYLHSTYRKLVRIANTLKDYELDDGECISFRNWLLQSKLLGVQMIEGVETMKDGIVRIVYNKKNQQGVDYIMNNLQENFNAAFGEEITEEMLGDDFDVVTKFNSELEDQHAQKIKSFGSNKSENIYQPGDSKSYSEITQSTMSISQSDAQIVESKQENDELRKLVLDLQSKFDTLERNNQTFRQTLKSTIKQELMKEFEGIITKIRNDMNTAILSIETKFETSIQQYETNAIAREQRMNEQSVSNFRLVAGELLNTPTKKTPSEGPSAEVDLRGGVNQSLLGRRSENNYL